jgi:hypothetical protein
MERRMPFSVIHPVLVWAIGLVGAAALARILMKERNRVNAELQRARANTRAQAEPCQTLRRDPRTGIYRP